MGCWEKTGLRFDFRSLACRDRGAKLSPPNFGLDLFSVEYICWLSPIAPFHSRPQLVLPCLHELGVWDRKRVSSFLHTPDTIGLNHQKYTFIREIGM
jgi:hypothetical protein